MDAASFSAGVVLDSDETIPSLLGLQNEDALLYEGKVLFDSSPFLRTPITGGILELYWMLRRRIFKGNNQNIRLLRGGSIIADD